MAKSMKQFILFLITCIIIPFGYSQTKRDYPHCDCTETRSASGEYQLVCGGIVVEAGLYQEGKRSGAWITRNLKGNIIIKAQYKNGVLDGTYEQYHYKGKPKLVAHFQDGLPADKWTYYSDKGKVIKEGNYTNGLPVGVWKVYDKIGKSVVAQHDFDGTQKKGSAKAQRYFDKGGIARDDASGEWMVLHFPNRNIESSIEPLGGYLYSGDVFVDYLNIPLVFTNTYSHIELLAELQISNGVVTVVDIREKDQSERFNASAPAFPFIVQTNAPNKLSRIEASDDSYQLLKDRVKEVLSISGPWITNGFEGTIKVQIPFVLNEIAKF